MIREIINLPADTINLLLKKQTIKNLKPEEIQQFPDFLCIGGQKCGTSWLYENLKKHSEIFIPDNRYIHFFDRNFRTSFREYLENFNEGLNLKTGEVIPGYGLISKSRIRFIKEVNPKLKIIFIMRNPINRAWSHAKMHYTKFKNRNIESINYNEFVEHFHSKVSTTKGDYMTIINKWESVYERSNFYYCFYEDISNRPQELLNDIFKHIGVSAVKDFSDYQVREKINKGNEAHMPMEIYEYLRNMYGDKITQLHYRFGEKVLPWVINQENK